jgi:hypothetical protein
MIRAIRDIITLGEELAEVPVGSFHWSSRKQKYQLCRAASCNLIMRELAIDYNRLFDYIKSRDRISFYYYYNQHNNNMAGWDAYRILYKTMKAHWLAPGRKGDNYMDRYEFELILNRNSIPRLMRNIPKNSQKVRFNIRIGNFEGNIYRDSQNAANCFKMLFSAFSRFDNEITIRKLHKYERVYTITPKASRK